MVLFLGFAVAATLEREALMPLLRAAAVLIAGLVLIGLLQVFTDFWAYTPDSKRAASVFVTANTFATVINLFLLPLVALWVSGRGGWKAAIVSLWLFAGLLSTESRGGWIAFLAGLAFISAYMGLPKTSEAWVHWRRIVAGLVGVLAAYYTVKALVVAAKLASGGGSLAGMLAEDIVARGTSYRIDLANVALRQIAERPFGGAGANTFWPLYEMNKPPELDIGLTFPFVHNDYLQTWVEFGLPGIVLLCAILAAALAIIFTGWRTGRNDPVPLVCGAAAAGIFVHALVDFPLYVPFPLVVLGAWLGVLAAHGADAPWARPILARTGNFFRPLRTPLVSWTVTVAVLAWLAQPALGEFAASRATSRLSAGHADEGLYWQSVARRLEPRSGRRYWEEGVIWRDQALESGGKMLAANADAAFAEGMRVDPYDVNNFVDRARLHRLHPNLLEHPASPGEILSWIAHVVKLRPYMLVAQAEYARTLAHAGRPGEARRLARAMVAQHPDSQIALRLAAEM